MTATLGEIFVHEQEALGEIFMQQEGSGSLLLQHGEWCVIQDDSLDHFTARVYGLVIYVSEATWETLSYSGEAIDRFLLDMMGGGDGMKFIVQDVGPYAVAAQAEAAAQPIPAKDKLTSFAEQAQGLIVQAASLNRAATSGQLEVFAVRYARLCDAYAELEGEMERLRGLLDLAATAIYEA